MDPSQSWARSNILIKYGDEDTSHYYWDNEFTQKVEGIYQEYDKADLLVGLSHIKIKQINANRFTVKPKGLGTFYSIPKEVKHNIGYVDFRKQKLDSKVLLEIIKKAVSQQCIDFRCGPIDFTVTDEMLARPEFSGMSRLVVKFMLFKGTKFQHPSFGQLPPGTEIKAHVQLNGRIKSINKPADFENLPDKLLLVVRINLSVNDESIRNDNLESMAGG